VSVTYRREIDGCTYVISLAMELNTFKGLTNAENVSTVLETDCRLSAAEDIFWANGGTGSMPVNLRCST
jgi:hypothetical protein